MLAFTTTTIPDKLIQPSMLPSQPSNQYVTRPRHPKRALIPHETVLLLPEPRTHKRIRKSTLLVSYLTSILAVYLLLLSRAHWHSESLWRPHSWRKYTRSEAISAAGEQWFGDATGMKMFLDHTGEMRVHRSTRELLSDGILPRAKTSEPPLLCLAIDAFSRDNVDYLPATLGSSLMGLSPSERSQIHVVVQFKDGTDHPLHEPITRSGLADEVIVQPGSSGYNLDGDQVAATDWLDRYATTKRIQSDDASATLDYAHILTACIRSHAPFIIVLEDDVVADTTWFNTLTNRIIPAIRRLERKGEPWLYVFLFWSHQHVGWENPDAPGIAISFIIGYMVLLSLVWSRKCFPSETNSTDTELPKCLPTQTRSPIYKRLLLFTLPLILAPHASLFLLQGKHAAFPTPNGLSRGETTEFKFYCCSQAHLFSRDGATEVVEQFLNAGYSDGRNPLPRDSALLQMIQPHTERTKLIWQPSLYQHIGTLSSWGATERVHRLRNWAFERWI